MVNKYISGQVALIVLVVSAVALTMGLSLSRKTTTEIKIETDEEALKQAFNAAESGVEYYLSTGTTKYTAPSGRSAADVTVTNIGGGATIPSNEFTQENRYALFWLVGHNDDATINYADHYAGTSMDVCVPDVFAGSIAVNYYYRDLSGEYRVSRYIKNYGSGSDVVSAENSIDSTGCTGGTKGIELQVDSTTTPLLVTVMPLFTGTRVVVEGVGGANFPTQGKLISSVGRSGEVSAVASGNVSRKLSVFKVYRIPEFMLDTMSGDRVSN